MRSGGGAFDPVNQRQASSRGANIARRSIGDGGSKVRLGAWHSAETAGPPFFLFLGLVHPAVLWCRGMDGVGVGPLEDGRSFVTSRLGGVGWWRSCWHDSCVVWRCGCEMKMVVKRRGAAPNGVQWGPRLSKRLDGTAAKARE